MKPLFLRVCRALGLFHLAHLMTRKKLLILCYHGFELDDESKFRPSVFMKRTTFAQRLALLKRHRFQVLSLTEGLDRLSRGRLPPRAVCITIDDGFRSVAEIGAPQLAAHDFPATLYLTTYYVQKDTPIFRLAVQYMFWKSPHQKVELRDLPGIATRTVDRSDPVDRDAVMWEIITHGESSADEPARVGICQRLGEILAVDYEALRRSGKLSLVTPEQVRELADRGIDIQLHTHRHRISLTDAREAQREVDENRAAIKDILPGDRVHFCFPSGIWDPCQWPWLEAAGVHSATTCRAGLNDRRTPRLGLFRILDGEPVSSIEFEAELWGFLEVLRRLRGRNRDSTPEPERSVGHESRLPQ